MKKIILFLFAGILSSGIYAQEAVDAIEAYSKEDYSAAAAAFEQELTKGVSAELYYNLGNAYYKMDKPALAVLNYERALLLAPRDKDIRINLKLAQQKIVDKEEPVELFFLVEWFRDVQNLQSSDAWAKSGIVFFILCICFAFLFFFGRFSGLRKLGFYIGIVFLILAIFANIFAYNQKKILTLKEYAIILAPSITVKSSPNPGGTDLFVIHEGLKVRIKNTSDNDWVEIESEGGKVGWIPVTGLERI